MSRDGRSLDHAALERIRFEAIERVSAGERPSEVIASYGLCRTTIYKWLRVARTAPGKTGALASTKPTGRRRALTPLQEQTLLTAISGHTPADYGLSGALWTRQLVAELIKRQLDITLRVTAVGNLLARLIPADDTQPFRARPDDSPALKRWQQEVYAPLLRRVKSRGQKFSIGAIARKPQGMALTGAAQSSSIPRARFGLAIGRAK